MSIIDRKEKAMMLNDLFHTYALKHGTETAGMLQDYPLDSRLDRTELNNMILLELGDRIPYYNDTTVMKYAIDNWFYTHRLNIKRLLDAILTEYDPLFPKEEWEEKHSTLDRDENINKEITKVKEYNTDETKEYNSQEEMEHDTSETTIHNTTDTTTHNTTDTTTYNTTDALTYNNTVTTSEDNSSRESTNDTTETQISAYNASTYQPQSKNIESGTDTVITENDRTEAKTGSDSNAKTGTETVKKTGTDTDAVTGTEELSKEGTDTLSKTGEDVNKLRGELTESEAGLDRDAKIAETDDSTRHLKGRDVDNIAELIEAELKLAKFNVYQWIVDNLGDKICLGIF